ncbi:YdcF family protein [Blastochloris sulfoviridis]|nr:YdcF family protein [Blastochloris sulfoviridis]
MTIGQNRDPAAPPRRRFHRLRLALELVGLATLAGLCAGIGGFFWFAAGLDMEERPLSEKADAIVVPTGGASRIEDGLVLLGRGLGQRLLITGVNRSTRAEELARLAPQNATLFACCVDIDRRALNTNGNAIETGVWARRHGFRSLIVVTSAYHMPRVLVELGGAMPDVALIPFPVVSDQLRAEPWWASPRTARLVALEYVKYLMAHVRLRLDPPTHASALATAQSH